MAAPRDWQFSPNCPSRTPQVIILSSYLEDKVMLSNSYASPQNSSSHWYCGSPQFTDGKYLICVLKVRENLAKHPISSYNNDWLIFSFPFHNFFFYPRYPSPHFLQFLLLFSIRITRSPEVNLGFLFSFSTFSICSYNSHLLL